MLRLLPNWIAISYLRMRAQKTQLIPLITYLLKVDLLLRRSY